MNQRSEYSDVDAEPVVGTVVKDVDSTIFSLRDNMRKASGPEGYMSKQGYLKNKSDSDHKNIGKGSHNDFDRHGNSQNYTSAFQVEKSNSLPQDGDLVTPPRVGEHEQNGYDFTLHTSTKDQNTRRQGKSDGMESGSRGMRDFNPPTEMREPSEDGVGDDEPTFPIILNKRELLKDQNRSHENRLVSQEPDDDEDPNDDGAEGGDVPERDEPEQEQDELEELEEQEEQDEDEEDDRSIEQKAIINKNNSKSKTKVQPKKPQISLNAIKNTRVNQKPQEKKKSISITSKSPRNNENDKSDIDGILKQLAAFLANNTQGKGAATSNFTSDQIDKKIKKLGKNPIKNLPPKKLLDNENEFKPKVQKPKAEKPKTEYPTRPSKKGSALPNLGIRYAYGDQNAPKNKSYTVTEKIRANSRPKYMDALRNPTQTPSPVNRITPNANLADLQKKQAAIDWTKPRTANNAQRGFSQDHKQANETTTNGGRAERSKRISSNLLRPTPTPTRTFIKPSIRVEAALRKSQDRGNLSARSSKSDLHAQQTSITPKKLNTNRSARGSGKKDVPQFDNNHLVRALYRVDRAVSKRSLR